MTRMKAKNGPLLALDTLASSKFLESVLLVICYLNSYFSDLHILFTSASWHENGGMAEARSFRVCSSLFVLSFSVGSSQSGKLSRNTAGMVWGMSYCSFKNRFTSSSFFSFVIPVVKTAFHSLWLVVP